MELQVLVSKKGTKVVTASNLHQALKLPDHKYNGNVEKWLADFYAFRDDVRKPCDMRDYAFRPLNYSKRKDYYLSIELAKLITLNSSSPVKQKYAKYLVDLDCSEVGAERLSKDQVMAVVELTKVMGLISCQKYVEKEHHKFFEGEQGSVAEWWQYRARLLGYSVAELKEKMIQIGKNYKGKNLLKMLMQVDKYEIIRTAVIDLFIALGKNKQYASDMGDLAKLFAREMKVEIWDDRHSAIDFAKYNVNPALVSEVKSMQKGSYLSLW